jgi:dTDP-4-amino-4,6-dideoxygalactose transaminase
MVSKSPERHDIFAEPRFPCQSARAGIEAVLRAIAAQGLILVPGYVGYTAREGSGVLDPIQMAGWTPHFVPVRAGLQMDLGAFVEALEVHHPKAVLLVNWFGFPDPAAPCIVAAARSRGVTVIVDNAHALHTEENPCGHLGDVSIYSIHKTLPTASGGMVFWRAPTPPAFAVDCGEPSFLVTLLRARVGDIAQRRRDNFEAASAVLSPVQGIELLRPSLPTGLVPHTLPLLVPAVDRLRLFERLRAEGIGVTALYYHMIEHLNRREHSAAFEVSDRILNLPIHQDLRPAEAAEAARRLRDLLEGGG